MASFRSLFMTAATVIVTATGCMFPRQAQTGTVSPTPKKYSAMAHALDEYAQRHADPIFEKRSRYSAVSKSVEDSATNKILEFFVDNRAKVVGCHLSTRIGKKLQPNEEITIDSAAATPASVALYNKGTAVLRKE